MELVVWLWGSDVIVSSSVALAIVMVISVVDVLLCGATIVTRR